MARFGKRSHNVYQKRTHGMGDLEWCLFLLWHGLLANGVTILTCWYHDISSVEGVENESVIVFPTHFFLNSRGYALD